MKARIVVIEDDPQIRSFLATALAAAGYEVFESETGRRGLSEVAARRPDIVLLDLGLPDMNGLEVLAKLRAWSTTPVVILSARGQEEMKVRALDAGADDYLVKPFGTPELLARLRVSLRHAHRGADGKDSFSAGDFSVDFSARRVTVRDRDVRLTPTEFKLLVEFVRHAGRVLTHRQLLRAVWGPDHAEDTHYLRLFMAQLRRKLEDDPADPQLLLTEQGVGYRLQAD